MTHGLHIVNSNGITQIDQNYANYYLIKRGFVYVPARTSASLPAGVITWPLQVTPCLVFVRPPFGRYVANTVSISSVQTFEESCTVFNPGVIGTPDMLVEYAVYAPRSNASPDPGHGLQVFKPDGTVAFSSSESYLRIVAGQSYSYGGNHFTISIPASFGASFFLLNGIGWYENYREDGEADTTGNAGALITESEFRMGGYVINGSPNNATRVGTKAFMLIAKIQ